MFSKQTLIPVQNFAEVVLEDDSEEEFEYAEVPVDDEEDVENFPVITHPISIFVFRINVCISGRRKTILRHSRSKSPEIRILKVSEHSHQCIHFGSSICL